MGLTDEEYDEFDIHKNSNNDKSKKMVKVKASHGEINDQEKDQVINVYYKSEEEERNNQGR